MSSKKNILLALVVSVGLCNITIALANDNNTSVSLPPAVLIPNQLNTQQLQLQLQAQKLQLQRQIIQIDQRLLQLQQQAAQQKQITTQTASNFKWVDAVNNKIPNNAIVAAFVNNKPLYICHADYLQQGTHPGQTVDNGCLITYGGRAIVQKQYQILTGTQTVAWKSADQLLPYLQQYPIPYYAPGVISNMKDSPIQGGYEPDHTIYICRAMYGENIHVGKVFGSQGQPSCNIGIDGSEIHVATFEALFSVNSN